MYLLLSTVQQQTHLYVKHSISLKMFKGIPSISEAVYGKISINVFLWEWHFTGGFM